jgi:hypothetical protein
MEDFLGKYYPGIKRRLHEQRIAKLMRILEEEKELYKKNYHEIYTDLPE